MPVSISMQTAISLILFSMAITGAIVCLITYDICYKKSVTDPDTTSSLPTNVGSILVEIGDPDGPYLFLDLEIPVEELVCKSYVLCQVKTNAIEEGRAPETK